MARGAFFSFYEGCGRYLGNENLSNKIKSAWWVKIELRELSAFHSLSSLFLSFPLFPCSFHRYNERFLTIKIDAFAEDIIVVRSSPALRDIDLVIEVGIVD